MAILLDLFLVERNIVWESLGGSNFVKCWDSLMMDGDNIVFSK